MRRAHVPSGVRKSAPSARLEWIRILVIVFVVAELTAFVEAGTGSFPDRAGTTAAPARTFERYDGTLSFEDRVRYQRRIEEVYWRHRIWPEENPGPKPALDRQLPDALLRERVAAHLEKSAALEAIWSRPLTGEQLQAELNRIARDTKNPALLRELFAALEDDPFRVAECLARPVLVDRLTRNWYARDDRFHGSLRERAESGSAQLAEDVAGMRDLGGEYSETLWRLADEAKQPSRVGSERDSGRVVDLDRAEWRERIRALAEAYDIDHESRMIGAPQTLLRSIPLGRASRLVEERDRFVVTVVVSRASDRLRAATVSWNKRPFDVWWVEEGRTADGVTGMASEVRPPSGGYRLPSTLGDGCTGDTWFELWYLPTARADHTAVWTGTEMIVWGGGRDINTGGRYDPATDSWTQTSVGDGVPAGRHDHTAVWTGTEMIVWGGDQGIDDFLNSGGRYDPASDTWVRTSTEPGIASIRANHTAVWTGTEMIVWGGDSGGSYLNTGGRYDPLTDGWTPTSIQLHAPTGRIGHTAVWTGTEMIVWGGDQGGSYANTGARYDPDRDGWSVTSITTGAPSARRRHTAVWTGTEMIVWGGYDGGYLSTGARYDPATDDWTSITTGLSAPSERENHTAVWTGTEMIVWGGSDGPYIFDYLNTGGRYVPSSDSWTPTSTAAGVPEERADQTMVWTGTEMIVWGGKKFSTNTGGRYDPTSDSWIATASDDGVPAAREYHTALWTGAEMIVWGGRRPSENLNTGGRYDPASNSWTPTSMTDVPSAAGGSSAVWTGTEMIVWGGGGPFGVGSVNSGGEYDPTSDTWSPTSVGEGVPRGRQFHTAVWTGTEMIVWGGYRTVFIDPFRQETYELDSGTRYDPATRNWTATSTAPGVPSSRGRHTAVWTGTEMIVWGGYREQTGSDYLNSGARYNPESDLWAATTIEAGVPAARIYHSAVWTGTEMIVWGGAELYPDIFDSGGRYDPLTDSWTATSTAPGVPTARRYHSAVWTGAEMIVWGGLEDSGSRANSGGRYGPATDSWTATSTAPGVPPARFHATAEWTGTEMIVWGGEADGGDPTNTGGLYCVCESSTVSTWYPDADGDGLGMESTGIPVCEQPSGYVSVAGDCDDRFASCTTDCTDADNDGIPACAPDCDETNPNCTLDCTDGDADTYCVTHDCDDANPDTHPGAEEVNDGLDNHCLYDHGYGIVDEITGVCGFHNPDNLDEFSWPPQAGATSYEVARSANGQFVTDCELTQTAETLWVDTDPLPPGSRYLYLVRALEPFAGSWGESSAGVERTWVCP